MTQPDQPFAVGFTADIYAWKVGQVLKLFNHGIPRSTVEYEANLARMVHESGLPVPAVGEIVEVGGRYGLEYERVEGVTMLQALMQKPWRFARYARQLAELQADIHRREVPDLPLQGEKLERKLRRAALLPENVRQAALKSLERLPEGNTLCHGDFHPGNVLLTSGGPVIIDWIDASRGIPVVDVARSTLLIAGGSLPPGTPAAGLIRLLRSWFYRIYIWRYFRLHPEGREDLSSWIPVAAAARLDENIHADEARLLIIAGRLVE